MDTLTAKAWGAGTAAALDRQREGGGVVTDRQINASLEIENVQLRGQLEWAQRELRELRAKLAAIEAPEHELITFTQAALRMGVHVSTISRWAAAGHCQLRYIGGRKKPFILASTLHRPARKKKGGAR